MDRRLFNKLLTASTLFSLSCKRPDIIIENKVKPQNAPIFENILEYSTCFPYCAFPIPLIVETYDGIPFRIKGNPKDNITSGTITPTALASNYVLFDKHRLLNPLINGKETNISTTLRTILNKIQNTIELNKKVCIITTNKNSPYFNNICNEIEHLNPKIEILQIPLFNFYKSNSEAFHLCFGKESYFLPSIENKNVIINFGMDFLCHDPFSPYYLSRFNKNKQTLITFENYSSLTGLNSIKQIISQENEILRYALSILGIILEKIEIPHFHDLFVKFIPKEALLELPAGIEKIIVDTKSSIVSLCNPYYPSEIHLVALLINLFTGNFFDHNNLIKHNLINLEDLLYNLKKLDNIVLNDKDYGLFIFLDYNPYFSLNKKLIELVEGKDSSALIQFSIYKNELTNKASTFVPLQTYFEFWADYEQIDSNVYVQQKIIEPINPNSTSTFEFAFYLRSFLSKKNDTSNYVAEILDFYKAGKTKDEFVDEVRNGYLRKKTNPQDFDLQIDNVEFSKVFNFLIKSISKIWDFPKIKVLPSQFAYSGEYANNVYLYEIPEPGTGSIWSHYLKSQQNKSENKKLSETNSLDAFNSLVYYNLDYLQRFFNFKTYQIEPKLVEFSYEFFIKNFQVKNKGESIFENAFDTTVAKDSDIFKPITKGTIKNQMYVNENLKYELQWAMIVDVDKCIGCNQCILACQLENNIPVVGIEYAQKNRIMHWVSVIKYKAPNGQIMFFPLICQHCDNAPCESVCPVGATSHSTEGINEMTYNQCIGSRICMANCPYKVRKFNFEHPEKAHLNYIPEIMNPFVSVRSRGVTEKCTFCIHRINFEKAKSKLFSNSNNFEVKTACEEICPVQAIMFGRKNHLLQKTNNDNLFLLLSEFNTLPNVFYKMKKENDK
ncbi:MAG: 4Fe-4S dicluster domain-containing protein [Ignavibacteria bacterium]|nr:4Fe-4S dicluster domain-containing protein [Ignavibacteria bacterium]